MAGLVLGQNNESFRQITNEWLLLCEKEHLLHPDSTDGYIPSPGLIAHRHDQSLLNCLVTLKPNAFSLACFDSNFMTSPVIIHRRGNVRSYSHAWIFLYIGAIVRNFIKFVPKRLRFKLYRQIMKYRKPGIKSLKFKITSKPFNTST